MLQDLRDAAALQVEQAGALAQVVSLVRDDHLLAARMGRIIVVREEVEPVRVIDRAGPLGIEVEHVG